MAAMKRCPRCGAEYGDDDLFCATDGMLATGAGVEVRLAVGMAEALGLEAEALRALAGDARVPAVAELGTDPRRGAFLAIALPPAAAAPLESAAKSMDMAAAYAV